MKITSTLAFSLMLLVASLSAAEKDAKLPTMWESDFKLQAFVAKSMHGGKVGTVVEAVLRSSDGWKAEELTKALQAIADSGRVSMFPEDLDEDGQKHKKVLDEALKDKGVVVHSYLVIKDTASGKLEKLYIGKHGDKFLLVK